jgi:flagellar biosynthesis regulator FlaF
MSDGAQDDRMEHKIEQVIGMIEQTQTEVRSIAEITERQSQMIERQSQMIDKMWDSVVPVLDAHHKKEELQNEVKAKIISAGIWGTMGGLLLLLWQGFKFFVKQD